MWFLNANFVLSDLSDDILLKRFCALSFPTEIANFNHRMILYVQDAHDCRVSTPMTGEN